MNFPQGNALLVCVQSCFHMLVVYPSFCDDMSTTVELPSLPFYDQFQSEVPLSRLRLTFSRFCIYSVGMHAAGGSLCGVSAR